MTYRRIGIGIGSRLVGFVVLALLVGFLGPMLWIMDRDRREDLDERVARAAALLRTLSTPGALALARSEVDQLDSLLAEVAAAGARYLDLSELTAVDYEGLMIVAYRAPAAEDLGGQPDHASALSDEVSSLIDRSRETDDAIWEIRQAAGDDSGRRLLVAMPAISGLRWGTFVGVFDLSRQDSREAGRRFGVWLLGAALAFAVGLVLVLTLRRLVVRPVEALAATVEALGRGERSARASVQSKDELGQLARAINDLADQQERATELLEARVVERSTQLARKNDQLAGMNKCLEDAVKNLGALATSDPLTGLLNRRAFDERLDLEIRRSARSRCPFTLLMIDVDHFKRYNDRHGHQTGDLALKRVAIGLRGALRGTDLIARYGGEEFVVMLFDTGGDAARPAADKLRLAVMQITIPAGPGEMPEPVTVSIGTATFPHDARDGEQLIGRADEALYAAKATGRNRVVRWEATNLPLRAQCPRLDAPGG